MGWEEVNFNSTIEDNREIGMDFQSSARLPRQLNGKGSFPSSTFSTGELMSSPEAPCPSMPVAAITVGHGSTWFWFSASGDRLDKNDGGHARTSARVVRLFNSANSRATSYKPSFHELFQRQQQLILTDCLNYASINVVIIERRKFADLFESLSVVAECEEMPDEGTFGFAHVPNVPPEGTNQPALDEAIGSPPLKKQDHTYNLGKLSANLCAHSDESRTESRPNGNYGITPHVRGPVELPSGGAGSSSDRDVANDVDTL
jgi:hypothetical protein